MFRMTAHNRESAFQAFNSATDAMAHYRKAKTDDSRAFERDVIRESVMAARMLRLSGIDYPSIP